MEEILKQREENIKILIYKGYTGNIETGKVYNKKGELCLGKHNNGYLRINTNMNYKSISTLQHQFIYYLAHGKVVNEIDHINGIRTDNRIENLRSVTKQINQWNRKTAKGYYWNKNDKKWQSHIRINGKRIYLGQFILEEDARQAYLNAKEKYHIIE